MKIKIPKKIIIKHGEYRGELKFDDFGFLVHHDRSKHGAIVVYNVVNGTKKPAPVADKYTQIYRATELAKNRAEGPRTDGLYYSL